MKSRVAHLLAGGNVQLPVKQEQVNRIAQLTQIVHEKSLGYRSCVPTLVLALNSRGNGAFTLPAVGAPCSPFFSRRPVTKSRVDRFYSHLFLILHFRSVSEKEEGPTEDNHDFQLFLCVENTCQNNATRLARNCTDGGNVTMHHLDPARGPRPGHMRPLGTPNDRRRSGGARLLAASAR